MGILNATPDSFYKGGRSSTLPQALKSARKMIEDGADWIDVGGESTRPGAKPVPDADEIKRVVPVIAAIRKKFPKIPISVDTQKASVASAALAEGAGMINDVSALRDSNMEELVLRKKPYVCLMHMKGNPATMQSLARYKDVVAEVAAFLSAKVNHLVSRGLPKSKIVIDPGLGFSKTLEHNVEILQNLDPFIALGCPLLIGASRKSFIGKILSGTETPVPAQDRLEGSLAVAVWAAVKGASILRVHDVAATRKALRIFEALQPVEARA